MVEHEGMGGVQEVAGEEIMTIEHIQPSAFEQIGQLLAKCDYIELQEWNGGWLATVTVKLSFYAVEGEGPTQLDAIRNAVEAAEQGVGE